MHAYIRTSIPWLKYGLVLLVAVTLLTACGDELFESMIFAPAMQLAQQEEPCDHLPLRYSCAALNPREVFFSAADGTRLQGLFIENSQSDRLLIYFHGNGSHIYFRMRFAAHLIDIANVFILSYRGYGKSAGTPSEAGLYADAQASIRYAIDSLGFEKSQIYLYGRSLGGAVAIHSAQNQPFAGLILVSTFSSGYDLAFERGLEFLPDLGQPFHSTQHMRNINIPVLFIHGDRDRLVPIEHSRRLYEQYDHEKYFHVIKNAGHWGIHRYGGNALWERISAFVNPQQIDIGSLPQPASG